MKKAIIAKKIGMTQVFTENGALVPVTVLEAGPPALLSRRKQWKTTAMKQFRLLCRCKGKESNKAHEGSFHKSRRSC